MAHSDVTQPAHPISTCQPCPDHPFETKRNFQVELGTDLSATYAAAIFETQYGELWFLR